MSDLLVCWLLVSKRCVLFWWFYFGSFSCNWFFNLCWKLKRKDVYFGIQCILLISMDLFIDSCVKICVRVVILRYMDSKKRHFMREQASIFFFDVRTLCKLRVRVGVGGLIQCEFVFKFFLKKIEGGGVSDHFELVLQVKIVKRMSPWVAHWSWLQGKKS